MEKEATPSQSEWLIMEVFVKTWIFTHGIAMIVSTNRADIAPEEIRQLLIEACASFKLYHNENKGGSANETYE